MHPGFHQRPDNGLDQNDLVAILLGLGAAFLWADPLYDMTIRTFQQIALRNYGRDSLHLFEWAYWIGCHLIVFAVTRVAVKWALVALITGVGYRLALAT
ncbi:MAG: hypothetical protein HLUCCO06_17335 [Halomonas sp. HL-93]|nr:MAG: hypothetical protein HLUCCO06_17335 [Halomonas sp. HL-93]